MATIYIDDQPLEVEDGDNVLQAVLNAGLDLPYFCWHPEMGSVGACRQCALVQYRDEEDTRGRIVMGCMTPVTDGARFSLAGEAASEFRENIVESLMLNHPHDCPVCAEGGECHLQDMTVMVGHRDRRYRGKKNTHVNQYLGPLINHEMNRCIACYRCTRYYQDYAGGKDLSAQGAHDHVYFGRQQDGVLESEFAGNLVEVCPTGVFTDKPLNQQYTRKWDLQSAPSVCTGCALGCNTSPGERYGKLKRIHNRYNNEVNGYFLCDRGRYGGSYVNDEARPGFAGQRNAQGSYDAIAADAAVELASSLMKGGKIAAIGSPRASLESNHLLRELAGAANFSTGMADHETALVAQISQTLRGGSVSTPSMRQVENADAVLILGEDVTNTAPRLALALRQSIRNKAKQMAAELRIPPWQDEAIRNIGQDQLSPLFVTAVADTPLDDVAEHCHRAHPDALAQLGFAVAAAIDTSLPAVTSLDSATQELATQIASELTTAKRPLVVSGTGCQNAAVISAASAVAEALKAKGHDPMLSYCLPEANSLGVSLLAETQQASLSELSTRAQAGDIDTLLVLENDLYRRAPAAEVEQLLNGVKNLIVLDILDTPTVSHANLFLPAASFAEAEGTLVSSEGRAQRHYPVFLAADDRSPSWQWLTRIGRALGLDWCSDIKHFDDVMDLCANGCDSLHAIGEASPDADYRNRGVKIPRQPHRYSGRTAMRANLSVHEPKQPEDSDSPLAFTMEGHNGEQPGALLPFVWSPGWNSNQSLHKFQAEIGGSLEGGTAGKRLLEAGSSADLPQPVSADSAAAGNGLTVVPIYKIFGSDELSARCDAIDELCPDLHAQINSQTAGQAGLAEGDSITLTLDGNSVQLPCRINAEVADNCIAVITGLADLPYVSPAQKAAISGGGHD